LFGEEATPFGDAQHVGGAHGEGREAREHRVRRQRSLVEDELKRADGRLAELQRRDCAIRERFHGDRSPALSGPVRRGDGPGCGVASAPVSGSSPAASASSSIRELSSSARTDSETECTACATSMPCSSASRTTTTSASARSAARPAIELSASSSSAVPVCCLATAMLALHEVSPFRLHAVALPERKEVEEELLDPTAVARAYR